MRFATVLTRALAPFLASPLLLSACRTEPPAESPAPAPEPPWFEEVAAERGLDFTHDSGHREDRYLMPESAAGGAALADFDGDGILDAYLVQSAGANRLYRGLGGGRFEDVTGGSGAGDSGYGMGVATGDVDNDGDLDLYVTNVGANVLLRNDGPGADGGLRFTDVTAEAGVGDPGFGSSAAFADLDRDGDLDLFAVNYLTWSAAGELECWNRLGERDYCNPQSYDAPAVDVLYRNDGAGDGGTPRFTDVTAGAGLTGAFGNGLGVVAADFDGDGWTDVFVANDATENQLWINLGASAGRLKFEDRALAAGCAMDGDGVAKAGMGVAAADVDDDGDADLLVMNLVTESDSFYSNQGRFFADRTAAVGLGAISRPLTRFGVGLVDFDNDGELDLYEAAGRVARQAERFGEDPYAEPNLLFRGVAGRQAAFGFEEVLPRGGTAALLAAASRAAAFGDVDNDGGVDVLVANRDGPAHLLLNVAPGRGHWIQFRVHEEHGRDALGARVSLRLGERRLTRTVRTAYSYCAANDPRVHVGLGEAAQAREVSVEWIDGEVEAFGDFAADRVVTLRRGEGTP